VRLTREGIPSPGDRRAQLYGRPMNGGPWTGHTLKLKALPERKPGHAPGAYGPHHRPGMGRGR
jgi:site-specific DNA recombinase